MGKCEDCGTTIERGGPFTYNGTDLCCECMAELVSWFLDGGTIDNPEQFAYIVADHQPVGDPLVLSPSTDDTASDEHALTYGHDGRPRCSCGLDFPNVDEADHHLNRVHAARQRFATPPTADELRQISRAAPTTEGANDG